MRKIVLLCILFLFLQTLRAQKSFGNLVLGIESGFDVAQFTDGWRARMSPDVQAEYSIGPVSLGAGFGVKIYPEFTYYTYTGRTIIRDQGGVSFLRYLYDQRAFVPRYWTVPLKINVRVHRCDCVYLHAGLILNNINLNKPDHLVFSGAEFDQPGTENVHADLLVKKHTKTIELGVGFNVFRREFFRLVARPAYVLSENPQQFGDAPKWLPTLRFTFGAQFGLWRE